MKTPAFIASVAVLFLATGTAHARPSYPSTEWVKECSTPAKTAGDNVLTLMQVHGPTSKAGLAILWLYG
jgi:hypothetical protein